MGGWQQPALSQDGSWRWQLLQPCACCPELLYFVINCKVGSGLVQGELQVPVCPWVTQLWGAGPVSLTLEHPFIRVGNGSLNNWCAGLMKKVCTPSFVLNTCPRAPSPPPQTIQEGGTGGQNSISEMVCPKGAQPLRAVFSQVTALKWFASKNGVRWQEILTSSEHDLPFAVHFFLG